MSRTSPRFARMLAWWGALFAALLLPLGRPSAQEGRKVVFLAGTKSHGPGHHEYERGLRLLAECLVNAPNLRGVRTEVHSEGWPQDPATLQDADSIVLFCDGANRDPRNHPFLIGDRLKTIDRLMRRGVGLVVIHYGLFAGAVQGAPELLEWVGGHFDYESGEEPTRYWSRLRTAQSIAMPVSAGHPVLRGVTPFPLHDEYYINMRFRAGDDRVRPLISVELPGETEQQTVAWATHRRGGGRGFAFTGGHFHENWEVPGLRRLLLNAIAWTARLDVPRQGVSSLLTPAMLADLDPDSLPLRVRMVTGDSHPAHDWRTVAESVRGALAADRRIRLTTVEDPETLASLEPGAADVILLNYRNWNRPSLGEAARAGLLSAVRSGTGLVVLHNANAAWLDWTDGARLIRRAWIDGTSGHDALGEFTVEPDPRHPITRDLPAWQTRDELYYRQQGSLPVTPVAFAVSKDTGAREVLAFTAREGAGRIFQCMLGHDAAAVSNPGTAELLRRGVAWAAGREPRTLIPRAGQPSPSVRVRLPDPVPGPRTAPGPDPGGRDADWPLVHGDEAGTRFAALDQVNTGNVRQLRVAWTYRTGDAGPGNSTTIECTPIVVEGVMYLTTAALKVVALDAATGRELWRFDTKGRGVNRGVAYWSDGNPGGKRRILMGTEDGRLFSLDARDGRPDPRFGSGGMVDLRSGMGPGGSRLPDSTSYGITSAPLVFEDLVVLPIRNPERQAGPSPGDVRALDVRTGRDVWRFRTVPLPGTPGHETWLNDGWRDRAGANPWSGFTLDRERGLLFCGTGSVASDFWGGDRPGNNLFANCTLALDARTGKRKWHFQTVHHDLWDHDNPCPPVLVTVRHNGKLRDGVAQPTKLGFVFLFDRDTGEPLFPVEERPVPPSDVPGEWTSPTQPFPVKPPPICPQSIGWDDLTNISPEANAFARKLFAPLRGGPVHTPPSLQGTVTIPGYRGGATWSGASFDPRTGVMYINSNNIPNITVLVKSGQGYQMARYQQFLDQDGLPAVKPPWGTVNAVDLNRGEILWQVPLGEEPKLRGRGFPPTGSENFGGTIVTAGGLVFIGAGKDERFHAYDTRTGRSLWEAQLPAGGYATPCTYMARGRQYVVIAAGGGGKPATRSGDAFVAYALPEDHPGVLAARGTARR